MYFTPKLHQIYISKPLTYYNASNNTILSENTRLLCATVNYIVKKGEDIVQPDTARPDVQSDILQSDIVV